MQQERLHDSIDVAAICGQGQLTPRHFRWQGTTYHVEAVNQRWSGKNGGIPLYYFAVSAAGQAFKLAFNSKELTWSLEERYAPTPAHRRKQGRP
ncbi:MAG: hypothetical protein ACYDBB_01300 [Armatimonadota bacterium]